MIGNVHKEENTHENETKDQILVCNVSAGGIMSGAQRNGTGSSI